MFPGKLMLDVEDILRHGSHVEVLGPPELKQAVVNDLMRALENYQTS